MSNLKQFAFVILYILVLYTMVKQGKMAVKKIATVEDQNLMDGLATGSITPEQVVINRDELLQDLADVHNEVVDPVEETDEVKEEAPAKSSTEVPISVPTFSKPKIQKKVKPIDEDFKTMIRNATEEERKQYVAGLVDNIREMTNKVEWVKQEFDIEIKRDRKPVVNDAEITLKCEHSTNNVIKSFAKERTVASVRDEFAQHFGFKTKDFRSLTLAFDGKNICESSRLTIGTAIGKFGMEDNSTVLLIRYG